MRLLLGFFCFILALSLVSCDPGTTYRETVVNNSGYDLKLYIYNDSMEGKRRFYLADSFAICKHSVSTIGERVGLGRISDYISCDVVTFVDSIKIFPIENDSLSVNIDIKNPISWRFNEIRRERNGGGECECILVIEGTDIH